MTTPKTNKTEFMRWANEHSEEVPAPQLLARYREASPEGTSFGWWLRNRNFSAFNRLYNGWWLRNPGLFGRVYETRDCTGKI